MCPLFFIFIIYHLKKNRDKIYKSKHSIKQATPKFIKFWEFVEGRGGRKELAARKKI